MVVEKPLTIDPPSTRQIAEAAEQSGRHVVVTHNYRYSPRNSGLKQIVKSGAIGTPLSVTFEWVLDTSHGADYFRRWHRDKANSGGLLDPQGVPPLRPGELAARRRAGAGVRARRRPVLRRGEPPPPGAWQPGPERGTHDGQHSPWDLDLRSDDALRELYYDNESHDGYRRDQNVFGPGVTTEDNLAVIVDYERGATLSYALNAHSPWEGYRIAINGTEGRAELEVVERAAVLVGPEGNVVLDPSALPESSSRDRRPAAHRSSVTGRRPRTIAIEEGEGGHGGGDALLLSDVFRGPGEDWLERPSDWLDGVRSIAVGMAGNESLRTGLPVKIADLGLGVDLTRDAP